MDAGIYTYDTGSLWVQLCPHCHNTDQKYERIHF